MTVRVYRSTDSSAPVLTGQAGALVTLLDAVLVNGYGSKSAAGWTKPYSGTNKAAYRNNSTTGTGAYLRVDDNITSYFHRAYVTGYSAMTTIDAGTDAVPSGTQTYGGWGKSNTQDATARPWVIVADEFRFYIFVRTGENGSDWATGFFGDIVSYKAADAYRAMIMCRYTTNGVSSMNYNYDYLPYFGGSQSGMGGGQNGVSLLRDHTGSANPRTAGLHTDAFKAQAPTSVSNAFWSGSLGMPYPAPVNNGIMIAPVWVHHAGNVVRGHMPGLWAPLHSRGPADGDTFTGTGALAGKTFEVFNVYMNGQLVIETSDTWS